MPKHFAIQEWYTYVSETCSLSAVKVSFFILHLGLSSNIQRTLFGKTYKQLTICV